MLMRCCSRMLTSSLAVRPPRTGPQELWHVLPARSTARAMPVKAVHVEPAPRALLHQQGTAAQPTVCTATGTPMQLALVATCSSYPKAFHL